MTGIMTTLAQTLGEAYQERANLSLLVWQTEQDAGMRKVELTPAEGWPGKNAEQREIEAARVFANDPAMQSFTNTLAVLKRQQVENAGKIESLEAQRRACEWQIREQLVLALGGKIERPQDDPFDAAMQSAADEAMDGALDEMLVDYVEFHNEPPTASYTMLSPAPDDDVPF